MPTYLEIAVNVPQVMGVFHYHVPVELEGRIAPGHLVEVPFGKQNVQGVVIRQVSEAAVPETKPVLGLIDPEVALTPTQIALAERIAENTLSSLAACISLMLPAGLSQQVETEYRLAGRPTTKPYRQVTDLQRRLLNLLDQRGPLTGRQINRHLPHINWRAAMRALQRSGLVAGRSVLPSPRVKPKSGRKVQLACDPDIALQRVHSMGRQGSRARERREAIIRYLITEQSAVEVSWLYAVSGGNAQDLRWLVNHGVVTVVESEIWRDPLREVMFFPKDPPVLTPEQQNVWKDIQAGIRSAMEGNPVKPFLLHGVTGSGKTEIYLKAVAKTLEFGRSAIVLVPEIALTPQTVRRFLSRFPGLVGLMHSGLSAGERYDTWRRARRGEVRVVIGPRSALFTPFHDLGLIVVDECHDDSYYQGEIPPYYHARRVAIDYARLTHAVCLLGSATPDLTSRYQASRGELHYLQLPDRILAHREAVAEQLQRLSLRSSSRYHPLSAQTAGADLPPVQVVDMRQELRAGNRSIFSRALQNALARVLGTDQQAILFLNRRGTATYVFCRDCGKSLRCPRCDTPLTLHNPPQLTIFKDLDRGGRLGNKDLPADPALQIEADETTGGGLVCHHCGYQRRMPKICPNCGKPHIRHYGTGTERVEAEIRALFPTARTLRWDYETTRQKGAHDLILSHFQAHNADILIGTQMLAKGLDLPLVTLVGVILAEVGLNLPDYQAAERVFQVLTQVAGRAGRSPLGGEVILQTYDPDHYVIQAAAHHDYAAFYERELENRRKLGYPPFSQMVRLEFRHPQRAQVERDAITFAGRIRRWLEEEGKRTTEMIGPVPCFYARLQGQYRWQIVLRGPDPLSLLRGRQLGDCRVEVNPPSLL